MNCKTKNSFVNLQVTTLMSESLSHPYKRLVQKAESFSKTTRCCFPSELFSLVK